MYFLLCHFSFWQASSQVGLENVKVGNKVVRCKKKKREREGKGKYKKEQAPEVQCEVCWEPTSQVGV